MFVKVTAGIPCHQSQNSNPPWPDCHFPPPPGCFHAVCVLPLPLRVGGKCGCLCFINKEAEPRASSVWASVTIVDPTGGKMWQRPQSFTVLVTVAPSPEKMWKTILPDVKTGTRIIWGKLLRCGAVMLYADKPGILAQAFKPSTWGAEAGGASSSRSGWSV